MDKYLIEVPHESAPMACTRAVRVFLETGSHWLTHAEWGCFDGVHKAWLIVEMESREAARHIVPPSFQPVAKIVKLNHFNMETLEEMERQHQG